MLVRIRKKEGKINLKKQYKIKLGSNMQFSSYCGLNLNSCEVMV